MATIDLEAQAVLQKMKNGTSVSALARQLGVNKGLVSSSLQHGQYSPTLRQALGLPCRPRVVVDACPQCGGVHQLKGCPDRRRGKPQQRHAYGRDVPRDFNDEQAALYREMHRAYSEVAAVQVRALFAEEGR